MVRELTMQHVHPTADIAILRKVRELSVLAALGQGSPERLADLSQGFQDLSVLADSRREFRMACVSKAMSTIFKRMPEGNPEDLPFILATAVNFLDSVQALSSDGEAGVEP